MLRSGQQQTPTPWQPDEAVLGECRQLAQGSEQRIRPKTSPLTALEALPQHPVGSAPAARHLRPALGRREAQLQLLETERVGLWEPHYARQRPWRGSLPGMGRQTAALLLLFAKGLQAETYRPLTANAGLCPRAYSSGTRVRGKSRIRRRGGGLIGPKLLRCHFSAKKAHVACNALYDRLVAKGKKGKLALMAVCHKLLKQTCAIVQSGIPYPPNFARIPA